MRKTSVRWSVSRPLMTFAAIAVVSSIGTVVTFAQDPPGPIPGLLNQILAAIGAVQETLNSHVAADDVSYRFTPPVGPNPTVSCTAVNISDAAHRIQVDVLVHNQAANTVDVLAHAERLTPAGQTVGTGLGPVLGPTYCKFTVLDGTKRDIRGSLRLPVASLTDPERAVLAAE